MTWILDDLTALAESIPDDVAREVLARRSPPGSMIMSQREAERWKRMMMRDLDVYGTAAFDGIGRRVVPGPELLRRLNRGRRP